MPMANCCTSFTLLYCYDMLLILRYLMLYDISCRHYLDGVSCYCSSWYGFVAAAGNAGLCSSVSRKGCQSRPVSFAIVAKTVCKVVYCKLHLIGLYQYSSHIHLGPDLQNILG